MLEKDTLKKRYRPFISGPSLHSVPQYSRPKNEKIDELDRGKIATARSQIKFLVCPNCLRDTNLGRWNENDNWEYRKDDTFASSTLDIRSKPEYLEHVNKCPCVFKNGINKIDDTSEPIFHEIMGRFAKWSRRVTGWDTQQICKSDFTDFGREVIAYLYKDNAGPVSYVAFRKIHIESEGKSISMWCGWDIFTFKEFRGNKLATSLFDYGIKDLKINRSLLPISNPVTKYSCELTKRASFDKIVLINLQGFQIIDKDKLIATDFN